LILKVIMLFSSFMVIGWNGVKFTAVVADAAFDAFVLIDFMGLFLFPDNGFLGALLETEGAAGAGFGIDFIVKQRFADAGRHILLLDVGVVFIPEVENGGQHRVGCRRAQAAKGEFLNHTAQFFEKFDVAFAALALADA
jgi:asparagine N-glycosylation enzyme membrane subunit Stt3